MLAQLLLRVFIILLLIAANAFFVAAEFALVSVRDTRIQQLIDARRIGARTVQKLHQNFDDVLLTVQVGVSVASLALGWLGEPTVARLIEPMVVRMPHAVVYANIAATVVAFALITYFQVILGEIVPKSLALTRGEHVALAVAAPMDFLITLSRPILYLMNRGSRIVLRAFGSRLVREGGVHSPEELKLVVTGSRRVGMLPELQEDIIHHALDLGNVTVREVMVPRPDIFSLPADLSLDEAASRVLHEHHARVPVYDPQQGREHIVGILYARDLFRSLHLRTLRGSRDGEPELKVRQLMRDVLVVPETKVLTDLLDEFRQRKRHMAIVVDEFGSTAGLVTVQDVLGQLVGQVEEEFEVAKSLPLPAAGSMTLDAADNIRDLESLYEIKLPRDEGFETLGGFVVSRLQRIPQSGDWFEYAGKKFTVTRMEGHRVGQVKVETLQSA
ncbi:MAG: HlyC/CorC family transporter [Acidobacteria bacterium]|nr:MAG: HlyC/CorC family transporter [Acidobacteriota bacterium]